MNEQTDKTETTQPAPQADNSGIVKELQSIKRSLSTQNTHLKSIISKLDSVKTNTKQTETAVNEVTNKVIDVNETLVSKLDSVESNTEANRNRF